MQFLKEELREKILQSGTTEFYEKGFSKSSMRSIAKKSGITVGNIYRYFKGKNDLFDNIVRKVFNDLYNIANIDSKTININNPNEFLKFRDEFIKNLSEVVDKNRVIVLILLDGSMDTEYSNLKSKFYNLLYDKINFYFINKHKPDKNNLDLNNKKYEFIATVVSKACIDGFVAAIETFENRQDLTEAMIMVFDYYFNDFNKRFTIL